MKPLCIDLFCGLGGWTEGFLAEGYDVVGFDIEQHVYGEHRYPAQLVIQDVLTLHGSQFKNAAVIVASPPCQAYSYRAMPWSRARALPPPDNSLFEACFRIAREADVPIVVENVRGAQKWVGRAAWHFGSFFLWGDIPALMPITMKRSVMKLGITHRSDGSTNFHGQKGIPHEPTGHWTNPAENVKVPGLDWSKHGTPGYKAQGFNVTAAQRFREGVKQTGISGPRDNGKGDRWFQDGAARHGSKSDSRKAASAMIAKIPFPLAQHIARSFKSA
jgi:hypothetical protein